MRLCTICARAGSKRLPGKNLREMAGKPLVGHAVSQAREAGLFEAIACSSDSPELLAQAKAHGADILVERPAALASDTASKTSAIRHAVETAEAQLGRQAEILVDLDVTAPMRRASDIRGAVALLERSGATNVITGTPARRSPYFNLVESDADGVVRLAKQAEKPVGRSQDAPRCFDMNAAIYVWRRDPFMARPAVFYDDTRLFEMAESCAFDIDTELDFALVEFLMTRQASA